MQRTHSCGALRAADIGTTVILCGWVQNHRDHGGVIFIDLRDREGKTQVVFNPDVCGADHHRVADSLRGEWVIRIEGEVRSRGENANPNLATGEIEVFAASLEVLNAAETPPFPVDEHAKVSEEVRLRHRFVDLRRPTVQGCLVARHRIAKIVRDFFDERGFLDLETPILCKSTPEGARDYLVPSRVHPGHFYALPQSPQIFKQLLMVAGYDRYMQIARCFRDEDLRADRQPEFTQIDVEMSFVEMDDVMEVAEDMVRRLWREQLGEELGDVPRMTWHDAMARYGTDKPDLRFDLPIVDVTAWAPGCGFSVFEGAVEAGGVCRAINAKAAAAKISRRGLDQMVEFAREHGAKGLAWIKLQDGAMQGPAAKNIAPAKLEELRGLLGAEDGDILFFGADRRKVVERVMGAVRSELGTERLGLVEVGRWEFLWVHGAPMFEHDDEAGRFVSLHHPFTAPFDEDLGLLADDPGAARSKSYDLVLNGIELGGGSIRIHDPAVQARVFAALGIGDAEAREKFGFLLDALRMGAPPHGGIAFGLDRLVMLMTGGESIRDVIPFPKTQKATDLMLGAPGPVDEVQLGELHLVTASHAKV